MNREAGFLTVARWTLLDVDHETVPGSFWHMLMALNVFCGLVPSDNICYPTPRNDAQDLLPLDFLAT